MSNPPEHAVFDFVEPHEPVNFEQVTAVAVIAWTDDWRMVAVELQRGTDLPGGHVEISDTCVADVARREAAEEACIRIRETVLVGYLRSAMGFIAVVTAQVTDLLPFSRDYESRGRLVLWPEDFLDRYRSGDRTPMSHLIDRARAVYSSE